MFARNLRRRGIAGMESMHDRGDYKSGWQMEREWDQEEKVRKQRLARGEADTEEGEGAGVDSDAEDALPFACFTCREPFTDPVVTQCKHYFCEHCALKAPGDIVLDISSADKVLRVGSGLRQDGDSILATKVGKLRFQKHINKYWVEGSQKRYIPNVEDTVVGIMVDRRTEMFILDIGGPAFASLPILAFEGATRRSIPNLQVGAAVYARVVNAHRESDPELSCTDASGKSAGFGPLKGGYIFDCGTGLSRGLLSKPSPPVLEALGKNLSFEIAVGLNGRVWVNAPKVATTITVSNAIQNSEFLSPTQQLIMA